MSSRSSIRSVITHLIQQTRDAISVEDLATLLTPMESNTVFFTALKQHIADFIQQEILSCPDRAKSLALGSFGLLVVPEPVSAHIFQYVGEIYDLMNTAAACKYTLRIINNPKHKCFINPRITLTRNVPDREQIFEIRLKKNEIQCRQWEDVSMTDIFCNPDTPASTASHLSAASSTDPPVSSFGRKTISRKFKTFGYTIPPCLTVLHGKISVRVCSSQWFNVRGVMAMMCGAPVLDLDFDVDEKDGSGAAVGAAGLAMLVARRQMVGAKLLRVQGAMLGHLNPNQFVRLKELHLNVCKRLYIQFPHGWNKQLVRKIHYAPLLFQQRDPNVVQRELAEFPNLTSLTIPNDTHINKIMLPPLNSLDISLGSDILSSANRFEMVVTAPTLKRLVIRMILPNSLDESSHKKYFLDCIESLTQFTSLKHVFVFLGFPWNVRVQRVIGIMSKWSNRESDKRKFARHRRNKSRVVRKCHVEFGVYSCHAVANPTRQRAVLLFTRGQRVTLAAALRDAVRQVPSFEQARVSLVVC